MAVNFAEEASTRQELVHKFGVGDRSFKFAIESSSKLSELGFGRMESILLQQSFNILSIQVTSSEGIDSSKSLMYIKRRSTSQFLFRYFYALVYVKVSFEALEE